MITPTISPKQTPATVRAHAFAMVARADELGTHAAYRAAEDATRAAERRTNDQATLSRLIIEGERMMRAGDRAQR